MSMNMDDNQSTMSKDIAALQKEVSRLQKMISAQGAEAYYEVRNRTSNAYDKAAPVVKNAVSQIKEEGISAAGAAREHMTATTTALAFVGALGFIAGYLLSGNDSGYSRYTPRSNWWR